MAFWKESMINRLSNLINRNRSAAKISQVLCSNGNSWNTVKRTRVWKGAEMKAEREGIWPGQLLR